MTREQVVKIAQQIEIAKRLLAECPRDDDGLAMDLMMADRIEQHIHNAEQMLGGTFK